MLLLGSALRGVFQFFQSVRIKKREFLYNSKLQKPISSFVNLPVRSYTVQQSKISKMFGFGHITAAVLQRDFDSDG